MDDQHRFTLGPAKRATICATAAAALLIHLLLVVGIAVRATPNGNEPAHLAAGLYHWQTGRFDAYRVNPPLIRLWCSVPLACSPSAPRLRPPLFDDGTRWEWMLDDQLLSSCLYSQFHRHLVIARLMLLPLTIVGGIYCWRWATDAYGPAAGWAAWSMWIFCPNVVAWSATICPDVGATALGIASCYHFRRWMQDLHLGQALLATITASLAILAKSTWILLPPLLLLVWFCARPHQRRLASLGQLACMGLCVVMIIHLGYGFSDSNLRLRELRFRSQLLGGRVTGSGGNRFADTFLGHLPVPLPADFLLGLDVQRCDFERRKWSYLDHQWRWGSWPHYYVSAALRKVPVGFLLLVVMSTFQRLRAVNSGYRPGRAARRHFLGLNEALLLLPAMGMGIAVSSQTGFGHHFRYALPCLPFVFIHSSACFQHGVSRFRQVIAWVALGSGIVSSLGTWPLSHSYFNSAAKCIFEHPPLLESNLEWGEDLYLAARWLEKHPHARPAYHAVMTDDLARYMPLDWEPSASQLEPGWYIVSWQRIVDPRDQFACLRQRRPLARLGASLRVYQLTRADVTALTGEETGNTHASLRASMIVQMSGRSAVRGNTY